MLGGRYRVIGPLGAGGQAEALAAADTWCADLPVVLKRVAKEARATLVHEFAALRSLHHPALVEARDLFVADGSAYLVEAQVTGVPLADWAAPRSSRELAAALGPVAHALAHLHVRGLIHLDVSPANVLASGDRATLIDLGLARPRDSSGATGTPGFVAPEVLAGEAVSGAADVYGLAATFTAVLGGGRAWGSPDLDVVNDDDVRGLLAACLRESPASRPSALALARSLAWASGANATSFERPLVRLPVCGRREELARFDRWLAADGNLLEVSGAEGVGKTAFLEGCADRARCAGFTVLEMAAADPHGLEALVSQGVASAPDTLPVDLTRDLARMVQHPRLAANGGSGLMVEERASLAVLTMDALAAQLPVLVVVDDAEAATPAAATALEIWRHRQTEGGPRVLATTRSETSFRLGPVGVDGAEEMLRLAYAEARPRAEAAHLVELVGGLPGALIVALTHAACTDVAPIEITTVPELTAELPLPLEPLASAVEPVPEPVVRHLLREQEDGALLLRAAVGRGLLTLTRGVQGPSYRVPESVRRACANRAHLPVLARAFEDASRPLSAAALWASAGDISRAVQLCSAATDARPERVRAAYSAVVAAADGAALPRAMLESWARLAADVGELGETEIATAALRDLGATEVAAVVLGSCFVRLGRYHEALDAVDANEGEAARAVRARALYFSGRADEARRVAGDWRQTSDGARADLLDVLGHCAFAVGDVTEARQLLETAVVEAEATGDAERLSRARHARAVVAHRSGDLELARESYRTALASAGVLSRVSRTLNYAALMQDLGELAEARTLYLETLSRAMALANVNLEARVGVNLANLHTQLGELPAAVRVAEDTLRLCEETPLDHAAAMAGLVLAEAQLESDDVRSATATLERAAQSLERIDDRAAAGELDILRARLAGARGDHDTAARCLAAVDVEAAAHLGRQVCFWRARLRLAAGAPPDAELVEQAEAGAEVARGDPELTWRAYAVLARVLDRAADPRAAEVRHQATAALEALLDRMPLPLRTSYLACGSRRELAGWLRCSSTGSPPPTALDTVAYRRIMAINRRLAREHEIEPLLELIVDAATELLGAERGFLLLRRDGDGVRAAVARNFDRRSLEDGSQRISRSIANECLRVGEAILTTNAQEDQRFAGSESVAALKVRSVICVPLRGTARDDDPIIGTLYLDHRYQDRAFTLDDVELCESFADQVAIALENAGLLVRTREQERRLAAQNERLERLNEQLQREAAQYAEEAEAALRRLREEGPTVGVGRGFENIVGNSDKLRDALRLVDRFADTDVPVVIHGESGTGKELIARAIHERSSRRARAFVSINCGAIPETLIESELFGYRKGAFTGAVRDKRGLLHAAEGGTLLFDEVGEMPLTMQVKLLRVLQEQEFRPVGATASVRADMRVVSASHQNLDDLVAAGRLREDLFYRLRVVEIPVPALRERRQDIPVLVDHFCRQICGTSAEDRFTREALACLLGYDWPGNVRELENEVRRALALADDLVDTDDLSQRLSAARAGGTAILADTARGSLRDIMNGFERQVLLATLKRTGWNVRRAAVALGVSRAALYTRLNKFDINREDHA